MIMRLSRMMLAVLALLIFATGALYAATPVITDVNIERLPDKTVITFSFDRPTTMVFYTIGNPPQIIADAVGETLAFTSGLEKKQMVSHGQVNSIDVFEDAVLGDTDNMYGVDFLVINLDKRVSYFAAKEGNNYVLYVATSQDQSVDDIKPVMKPSEIMRAEAEAGAASEAGEMKPQMSDIEMPSEPMMADEAMMTGEAMTDEDAEPQFMTEGKIETEIKVEGMPAEGRALEPAAGREDTQLASKPSPDKITSQDRKLALQWRQIGYNYQQAGNYEKALASYQRAIEFNPTYASVYNDIGVIYFYMNNVEMAIKQFENSISIDPSYLGAYSNLGIVYEQLGDYEKAIYYWQKRADLSDKKGPWHQKAVEKIAELKRK